MVFFIEVLKIFLLINFQKHFIFVVVLFFYHFLLTGYCYLKKMLLIFEVLFVPGKLLLALFLWIFLFCFLYFLYEWSTYRWPANNDVSFPTYLLFSFIFDQDLWYYIKQYLWIQCPSDLLL